MGRAIVDGIIRSNRIIAGAAVVLVLLSGGCTRRKDVLAKLWLYRTCSKTGQAALEAEIRQYGEAIEPLSLPLT